jgi:uncharacterized protein (TIGR03067 family)
MVPGFALTLLLLTSVVPAVAEDDAAERARRRWSSWDTGSNLWATASAISAGDRPLYAGTYALEPAARPARIDFRHDEGEAKGQVWEGIYRLEDGRLSVCDDAPDTAKPRPTSFATSPRSGYVLVVFER